jgi:hypothetical protein
MRVGVRTLSVNEAVIAFHPCCSMWRLVCCRARCWFIPFHAPISCTTSGLKASHRPSINNNEPHSAALLLVWQLLACACACNDTMWP